jgi:hypothetical protein
VRLITFVAEAFFQSAIVLTGNYAWINLIGALPCCALADDAALAPLFSRSTVAAAAAAEERAVANNRAAGGDVPPPRRVTAMAAGALRALHGGLRAAMAVGLCVLVASRSVHPIKELFVDQPWLHYYDDYFVVNAQVGTDSHTERAVRQSLQGVRIMSNTGYNGECFLVRAFTGRLRLHKPEAHDRRALLHARAAQRLVRQRRGRRLVAAVH